MRVARGRPSDHGAAMGDAVLGPSRWGVGSGCGRWGYGDGARGERGRAVCALCRGRERRRGRRVDSARAALDLVLRSTKARAGRLYSTRATSRTRLAGSWQWEVGNGGGPRHQEKRRRSWALAQPRGKQGGAARRSRLAAACTSRQVGPVVAPRSLPLNQTSRVIYQE